MANAVPVHGKTSEDIEVAPKKKPLSKDAQKIKQELAEIAAEEAQKVDEAIVEEWTEKVDAAIALADGTLRRDF